MDNIKNAALKMESDSLIMYGKNWAVLGALFTNQKDKEEAFKKAIIFLTETINRGYRLEYSYYWRSFSKFQLNDFFGTISDLNKEIKINPNPRAYHMRALSKIALEDFYGAINDLTKGINMSNSDQKSTILDDMYTERGRCYLTLQKDEKAIVDLNKSIALNNENSITYNLRGLYYLLNNMKEKACLDWSKSGELGNRQAYNFIKEHCNN